MVRLKKFFRFTKTKSDKKCSLKRNSNFYFKLEVRLNFRPFSLKQFTLKKVHLYVFNTVKSFHLKFPNSKEYKIESALFVLRWLWFTYLFGSPFTMLIFCNFFLFNWTQIWNCLLSIWRFHFWRTFTVNKVFERH